MDLSLNNTSLLFNKYFDIKPVLMTIKNPQDNALVDQEHQVIFNIIFTKDLEDKLFDYIYPWGYTLIYIFWEIRAFYSRTIGTISDQDIFFRDIIFNLLSVVYLRVITAKK